MKKKETFDLDESVTFEISRRHLKEDRRLKILYTLFAISILAQTIGMPLYKI
jgi:hypothetical protein